jgi:hypothetical protein
VLISDSSFTSSSQAGLTANYAGGTLTISQAKGFTLSAASLIQDGVTDLGADFTATVDSDSILTGMDVITFSVADGDHLHISNAGVPTLDAATIGLTASSLSGIGALLQTEFLDLAANHAKLVEVTVGATTHDYLLVNDSHAGYNNADLTVELVGLPNVTTVTAEQLFN